MMVERARSMRWTWLGAALMPLLLVALVAGAGIGTTAAQDATPEASVQDTPPALSAEEGGRPAHIHAGTCEGGGVGPIVQMLNNLTVPEGEAEGQANALPAESSFTSVPLTLDDILDADHVVNVHLSGEDFDLYIACGEIGGVVDETGSLSIALKQANGSGFSGVAVLSPDAADATSTNVSLFLTEGAVLDTDTSAAASPVAVQATEAAEAEGDEEGSDEDAAPTQEAELEDADATREAAADEMEEEGADATPTN